MATKKIEQEISLEDEIVALFEGFNAKTAAEEALTLPEVCNLLKDKKVSFHWQELRKAVQNLLNKNLLSLEVKCHQQIPHIALFKVEG